MEKYKQTEPDSTEREEEAERQGFIHFKDGGELTGILEAVLQKKRVFVIHLNDTVGERGIAFLSEVTPTNYDVTKYSTRYISDLKQQHANIVGLPIEEDFDDPV